MWTPQKTCERALEEAITGQKLVERTNGEKATADQCPLLLKYGGCHLGTFCSE